MLSKGNLVGKFEMPDNNDPETHKSMISKEFYVFLLKFLLALVLILLGSYFIYIGINSSSIIVMKSKYFNVELNNAMPGVILVVCGFILMIFSRFNGKIKK